MSRSRGGVPLLACTAGLAIANNYAVQPALGDVARDIGSSVDAIGLVTTAALAGCIAGFAFLLPLADRAAPHRLVSGQLTLLATGLLLASASASLPVLLAAYVVIGAGAGVAAQTTTIAGRGAAPGRRATAVAVVATGMSAGILLSRFVGGALADAFGWRRMLLVFAALALLAAVAARLWLPRTRPVARQGYLATLAALPGLLRRHPALRHAVASGCLWYFAFSMLWVGLSLALAQPPYALDAATIGRYSLAGLLGFAALPVAGRLGDRFSPRVVVCAGMATAAVGAALLCAGLGSPVRTVVGLALVDAGCFAAQAANQARVLTVDPARSGSVNGVYLLLYFVAGALGTALAAPLLAAAGWPGVSGAVLAALLLGGALGWLPVRPQARTDTGDTAVAVPPAAGHRRTSGPRSTR